MERRLSPKDASTLIGYSVRTLRRWRKAGIGPQWTVLENGRIVYSIKWIRAWEKSVWTKGEKRTA